MPPPTPPYTRALNKVRWEAVNRTVLSAALLDSRILSEATEQRRSGAYREALATLAAAPAAAHDQRALIVTALARLGLDDVPGALEALDHAEAEVLYTLATVYLNRSAAHGVARRFEEQERWARAALDIDVARVAAWVNLLAARRERGDTLPELIAEMDVRWPAWPEDEVLRAQIEDDLTLRYCREHPGYRDLFVDRFTRSQPR